MRRVASRRERVRRVSRTARIGRAHEWFIGDVRVKAGTDATPTHALRCCVSAARAVVVHPQEPYT